MMKRRVTHALHGVRGLGRRMFFGIALAGCGFALATGGALPAASNSPGSSTEQLVHRYLQVVIAPDGAHDECRKRWLPPSQGLPVEPCS